MFADHAEIHVRAGNGGPGCMSFRREKYIPKGGPDGGDGGHGGDVIAIADPSIQTLMDFRGKHHWTARNGDPGKGSDMHGANGADVELRLPIGTMIYVTDQETDAEPDLLVDLNYDDRVVLARGGRGGFGNAHFKGPINQAPRKTTPGHEGEERHLSLELKLIADVGLVGMPNAGKSTLLRAVSHATPRVADYPFTTLAPHLGIAELDKSRRLVIADIPGLIEGAADGAGLGHDFLRHIERTRVIVHVLEIDPASDDPVENYRKIRRELEQYSEELAGKPEIIALNKLDLVGDDGDREEAVVLFRESLDLAECPTIVGMSGATGVGMRALLEECWLIGGQSTGGWKHQRHLNAESPAQSDADRQIASRNG